VYRRICIECSSSSIVLFRVVCKWGTVCEVSVYGYGIRAKKSKNSVTMLLVYGVNCTVFILCPYREGSVSFDIGTLPNICIVLNSNNQIIK